MLKNGYFYYLPLLFVEYFRFYLKILFKFGPRNH